MKIKNPWKMKKSAYKSGTLLAAAMFLVATVLPAQEATKDFSKEYKADKNNTLEINNKYGDVIIEASQTDQITINVKATVRFPNQEKAERLLGYIDVQFSEDGNNFKAKTLIDDKFSFSGWGSESRRFSIDYIVKMPAYLSLTVSTWYGDIELGDLSGFVSADVRYGDISAGKLSRGNEKPWSEISASYGKISVEEAGWLDISARYSEDVNIRKAQAILLDSKYSNVNIGSVSSIVGETSYRNLRIDQVSNLVLETGYTEVNVGTIAKKLVLDAGYGSFNADIVKAGFESAEISTRYAPVRLGVETAAGYRLDAKMSYGGVKYDEENFRNIRHIVGNTSTEVSGVVGKEESPTSTIKVDGAYASVKLL